MVSFRLPYPEDLSVALRLYSHHTTDRTSERMFVGICEPFSVPIVHTPYGKRYWAFIPKLKLVSRRSVLL